MWPGKYPTPAAVEREKAEAPSEQAYYREFMLKILPDNRQIVRAEDITYHDICRAPAEFLSMNSR